MPNIDKDCTQVAKKGKFTAMKNKNSQETKSDSTFAGKNNDVSDSSPDINKNMEKKWDNCERCYNLGIKEGKSWTKQDIDKIISWLILMELMK